MTTTEKIDIKRKKIANVPIENMSEMLKNLSKKGTDNND